MNDKVRRASTLAFTLAMMCVTNAAFAAPINAVIGDESWEAVHGEAPVEGVDGEVERIQTHLRHVISVLGAHSERELTSPQRARRAWLLDELGEYADGGVFPQRIEGDGYGVRRPQFIDSGGVHCAVGELLRLSGRGELAHRIDRDHEFDYVSQMDVPELAEWATEWGFSERELGMIQPGYSPRLAHVAGIPYESGVLGEFADRVVLSCGRASAPDDHIEVEVAVDSARGVEMRLVSPRDSEFARCAVRLLRARFRGRVAHASPVSSESVRLTLPTRQELLERKLERVRFESANTRCLPGPAPSPIPEKVKLRVYTNALGHGVEVVTEPSYPETEACIQRSVARTLALTKGEWKVDVTQTRKVKRLVRQDHVEQLLEQYATNIATTCHAEGAPEETLGVSVRIVEATQALSFEVSRGTDAFKACMREGLARSFEGSLRMNVKDASGAWTSYVRYDADAEASTVFEVETPEARAERFERHREATRR